MGQGMGSPQITLYEPSVLWLQLLPKSFFCLAKIHTNTNGFRYSCALLKAQPI